MENIKAQAIITEDAVKAALEADKGKNAKLDAWKIVPFTKKGDNFTSFVTSISVNYTNNDQKELTSYVAKMNPCIPSVVEDAPNSEKLFRKEGKFFMELLPELNLLMTQSGQKMLIFPKCYYAQYTKDKEMIIFEDLRLKGFKMTDRQKGMDLQHALLVMQGLGNLHAASILMQNKLSIDDIKLKYPFLFEEVFEGKLLELEIFEGMKTSVNILEQIGGYEKAVTWLKDLLPNLADFFKSNQAITPPFSVVCHGDCWTNNILFRYNDSGVPVEAMLLDVQNNRFASPATDLVYFMFSTLVGDVRKPNADRLLNEYFASFSSSLQGCGQDLPYTKEELVKEYKNKCPYGVLFGSMMMPEILLEGENKSNKLIIAAMDKNPLFKHNFSAMFDEMLEEGLFS